MKLYSFTTGIVATNCYLLLNPELQSAILIDAPPESTDTILATLEQHQSKLSAILLTHTHWDHIADLPALKRQTNAPVYVHPMDEYRLLDPAAHSIFPLPVDIAPTAADAYVQHNQHLTLAGLECVVKHTPGHTEGSVCFYFPSETAVFSGDTLFAGSIGRTDLPGGNMEQLINSIRTELLSLDDHITVYPGHGPSTTIGEERQFNPFLIGV